ncbi:hypothetical protein ACFXKG_06460 [Streptomyces sp. NPDC059255]|uniref:hypothetical protein n=1 Tax=Streptomyces sp. NPDC059255 TaxID=3346793 RepID=UPI0036782584
MTILKDRIRDPRPLAPVQPADLCPVLHDNFNTQLQAWLKVANRRIFPQRFRDLHLDPVDARVSV